MANKDAIVNKFYANEAVAAQTAVPETIKTGKYRVFNGKGYDTVHLQTSADQVIESESKKFVSQTDISKWNSKAEGNHHHDNTYAKKGDSYTKGEMQSLLDEKSDIAHKHNHTTILTDSTHRFVTDDEKARWSNTYTIEQANAKVSEAIQALEATNVSQHATITQEYKDADKVVEGKVATVQSNLNREVEKLKTLIDNGGTANNALAARVDTIVNTTIPGVESRITTLDGKFSALNNTVAQKADKTKVTEDIDAAKTLLQANIDLKANIVDVYSKIKADELLDLKANKQYVDTELALKANDADIKKALQTKAEISYVTSKLALKAEKSHKHNATTEIEGLGSAAFRQVGQQSGNVPVLNTHGKLDHNVLPAIAINTRFTANSPEHALTLDMQIGDILILSNAAREAVIQKQKEGKAITYQIAKSKSYQELSDEYITYIASGAMTYLCVDDSKNITFENKFKPLQSSADTISKGEVHNLLGDKVDKSAFTTYQSQVTSSLNSKADQSTTYNKTQVDNKLSTKVDTIQGKGLSTNDFTNELKAKLDKIKDGANNYSHPTGDGNRHVPATGTDNDGKVLMAGSSAGSLSWTALTADNVANSSDKKFVTPAQITKWNAKADQSTTYTKTQTNDEIKKVRTIVSSSQPTSGTQVEGAVWIEIV